MAERALIERYLSCHVCSETFRDPVSLSCNHSFCSSCLEKFWEQTGNKNCPICKRRSSKDDLPINFSLKELAESFTERQKSGSSETETGEKQLMVVCSKHQEDPKLFCEDEQRAVCPVCDFSLHQSHKVVPLEQAVRDLKEQLKSDLESLQDKRNKHKEVEKTYDDVIQHSKKQLSSTERQIRAEFNKLHQFLREEEESRLAALREEEEQKKKTISREMKRIEEQISSLSDSISAVEEELQKDNLSFLSSYKATQRRARGQRSLPDPQLFSGALIDVAKHLGNLSFRVWEKMKGKVKFSPIIHPSIHFLFTLVPNGVGRVAGAYLQLRSGREAGYTLDRSPVCRSSPIILDPNTAGRCLYLSDDLTRVRNGDTWQKLPDNPERNTKYTWVFGSEGFSSGKHSWEVKVGDHPDWRVGLVRESVDRKGERYASPEYGIWCLLHGDGKYTNGAGKTVTLDKSLQRIRVQLDYDRGEVSFYDSEDKSLIYTYRDTFTEKLFAYFSVGKAADAKTSEIKICQPDFSV